MKEMRPADSFYDNVRKILPFRFLEDRSARELLSMSQVLSFEEGENIICQGELNQSLYAVIKGSVKVTVHQDDGEDSYICTIGNGEVFGEAGMFLKVPRTANVVCVSDSTVVMIPRKSLLHFIRLFPAEGNKLLMMIIYSLLRKLKESNQELAYERRGDSGQDDIDALVKDLLG